MFSFKMNRFVLMVAMVVAVSVQGHKTKEEIKEIIKGFEKDCMDETKATDDDVALLHKHEVPTTGPGRCMISCMYTKFGFMKDGKYSAEAMIEKLQLVFAEDDPKMEKIKKIAIECEPKDVDEDVCEYAAKIMECHSKLRKEYDLPLPSS